MKEKDEGAKAQLAAAPQTLHKQKGSINSTDYLQPAKHTSLTMPVIP